LATPTRRRTARPRTRQELAEAYPLSVVIPARNSRDTLRRCLGALAENDLTQVEVLIVDDASSDGTGSVGEEWKGAPRVRLISLETRTGPAEARNRGLEQAVHPHVLFLDCDILLPARSIEWIRETLDLYSHRSEVAAVLGMYAEEIPHRDFLSNYKNLYTRHLYLATNPLSPYIHNAIRQSERSFDQAIRCLAEFKKLKSQHPNLSVGVALTVTSANQDRLHEFYRYVVEDLQPDAITITLARGDPIDPALKEVDLPQYQEFADQVISYRKAHRLTDSWADRLVIAKEQETYRLIEEAAGAASRISPCYAGQLIGILSEIGEVYVCETLDKSMGNVRDFDCDFAALWSARQAEEGRSYQQELGCQCTYECAMSVNTLFNPRRAARILWNSL